MTIEQAVRIVAARDGWRIENTGGNWTLHSPDAYVCAFGRHKRYAENSLLRQVEFYARSTDAIRPVLAKLTDTEWNALDRKFVSLFMASGIEAKSTACHRRWLLTLAPEQICLAVAEAIEACKGNT